MKELYACVAPKKKTVKIMDGQTIIHVYRFKRDVPFKIVDKEVHGYDYGAFSVADRSFTYNIQVKEYDADIIKHIGDLALEYYKQKNIKHE